MNPRWQKRIEGVIMLVLAGFLFWLPYSLGQTGAAHQKILVAETELKDGVFDETVIFIIEHTGYKAFGFVLNRPGDTPDAPSFGGPVDPDKIFVLFSQGGKEAEHIKFSHINKEDLAAFHSNDSNPDDYIVFTGYSGWGVGQLKRELRKGGWKVIDFDFDLIFNTSLEKMWDIASQRPFAEP